VVLVITAVSAASDGGLGVGVLIAVVVASVVVVGVVVALIVLCIRLRRRRPADKSATIATSTRRCGSIVAKN